MSSCVSVHGEADMVLASYSSAEDNFDLGGLDVLYALSQEHLNDTFAQMLPGSGVAIKWGIDQDGMFVDPLSPECVTSFCGILAVPLNGVEAAPLIELTNTYDETIDAYRNVTLIFYFDTTSILTSKGQVFAPQTTDTATGNAWSMQLPINLSFKSVYAAAQPVADSLRILSGAREDAMSLPQILAAASCAVGVHAKAFTPYTPPGVPDALWNTVLNTTAGWFAHQVSQGVVPLDFGIDTITQGTSTTSALLDPTSADYYVLPNAVPAKSALVLAFMTNEAPWPGALSDILSSWTFDFANSDAVAMISPSLLSQSLYQAANAGSPSLTQLITQNNFDTSQPNLVPPIVASVESPATSVPPGTYLSASGNSVCKISDGEGVSTSMASTSFSMSISTSDGNSTLSISYSCNTQTIGWGNSSLTASLTSAIALESTDSAAVQMVIDTSTSQSCCPLSSNSFSGNVSAIATSFSESFTSTFNDVPGGSIFLFSSLRVNNAYALVADITYQL